MHPPKITRRRIILEGAASLAAASLLPGCGASASNPAPTPTPTPTPATNPQPNPGSPLTAATLSVTATSTGSIGAQFIGLSYDKLMMEEPALFSASNTDLIALFQRIGVGVLRLGDGSNSSWTPGGKGATAGQIAPADVNALSAFVKAAGCACLYGVNLGGSAPGAAYPTTTTLAAAEVAYVNQTLGSSLYGIEIGNEPDGYINTFYAGLTPKWNVSDLETLWQTYRNAIVATTPGVPITGPACGTVSPVVTVWTEPFALAEKSSLSVLTQHYYRGNGQASPLPTVAQLVTPDTTLTGTYLPELQSTAQSIGLPYRISECNSYYNGGAPGVSDAYASALWAIDFLYNCAQGGAAGVNFHGGGTLNYTAIIDNNGVVQGVRPLYYGMLLFALAGQGTVYTTALNAGSLNATAYAVKTPTGLNLVVVNKDSAQNLQLSIQLPQTVNTATLQVMTQATAGVSGPSLSALSGVTIQGAAVTADGTFAPASAYTLTAGGSVLSCYVPYLSAVLIQTT